mgnify:CR=1 FL=1
MRSITFLKSKTGNRKQEPVSSQSGFSLVEMAVVIIILGLIVAAFGPAYNLYLQNQVVQETEESIESVRTALGDFKKNFGRYPLPASLTLERGEQGYGYESNWNDIASDPDGSPFDGDPSDFGANPELDDPSVTPAIASGSCVGGVCVKPGNRFIFDMDSDGTPDLGLRVRIGAVPFRALNLEESQSYDAYGSRLTYAVVERLARSVTHDPTLGVIGFEDASGESFINPANSGHFIVISHGPNRAGAFSRSGEQVDCGVATADTVNTVCDMTGNALFMLEKLNSSEGANQFDDLAQIFTPAMQPSWKVSESDRTDIYADNWGGTGILKENPQERLDIDGNVALEGDMMSNEFCDKDNDANCFETSLIAGEDQEGVNKCPNGQFMIGIKNGQIVCQASVDIACPPGEIMQGITVDGRPSCQDVPDCPNPGTLTICSASVTYNIPNIDSYNNVGDPPYVHTYGSATRESLCTAAGWQHGAVQGSCPVSECRWVAAAPYSPLGTLSSPVAGNLCTCPTGPPPSVACKVSAFQRGVCQCKNT